MKKLLFAVLVSIAFVLPLSNVEAGLITSWQSSGPSYYSGYADIWGYVSNSTDACRWRPISLKGSNSQDWKDLTLQTSGGQKYIPAFKYYLSESAVLYLECKNAKTLWSDTNDKSEHLNTVQPVVNMVVNGEWNAQNTFEINQGDNITVTWGASSNASACRWVQPSNDTVAFSFYGLLNGYHLPQFGSQTFGPNDIGYPTSNSSATFQIECTEVNRDNLISNIYLETFGKNSGYVTVSIAPPPPPQNASMTHTFADGTTVRKNIDVNGSVEAKGSGTKVTSCTRSFTKPSDDFPNVSYSGRTAPEGGGVGDLTVLKQTATGFSKATTGTPYNLNLTCDSTLPFVSLEKTSNLAKVLSPFLGFVEVAYAAVENKTFSLEVDVNALPNALLNINSFGASGVAITGLSGAPSGTTNYSATSTSAITGTLLAPDQSGGKDFTGWGGDCSGTSGYTCNVSVPIGSAKTVTVYYSQPVPSQPNLRIYGNITATPASPVEGEAVSFSATVLNDGDSSTGGNSTTQLKIDLDDNGGGSLWDLQSSKTTGNLASDATKNESWNNVWTAVEGIDHRIRVCADDGGVISESNESDNCTDTYVTVTATDAPPSTDAVLNVNSSGASGVSITRISGPSDIAGVTNYSRSYTSDFSTVLQAPATKGNATYTGWTGCSSVVSQNCSVGVNVGEEKTVVANYSTTPPPPSSFNYSLSNSGNLTIDKGTGVGQEVITRTLLAGTSEAVSISLSGLPSGVTSGGTSGNPCSPTCNSTVTLNVSSGAVNGTYPITVTGSPLSKTTNFNLIITGSPLNATCVPSPATAMIGQPVTWTAGVTGGSAPYTYSWSGSGVPTNPAPTANPYTLTYSTIGAKTITAQVTDASDETASCPANSTVQINFNPSFEEF